MKEDRDAIRLWNKENSEKLREKERLFEEEERKRREIFEEENKLVYAKEFIYNNISILTKEEFCDLISKFFCSSNV